jgi:hypothetical protein
MTTMMKPMMMMMTTRMEPMMVMMTIADDLRINSTIMTRLINCPTKHAGGGGAAAACEADGGPSEDHPEPPGRAQAPPRRGGRGRQAQGKDDSIRMMMGPRCM